jgi:hypothetical protein
MSMVFDFVKDRRYSARAVNRNKDRLVFARREDVGKDTSSDVNWGAAIHADLPNQSEVWE